MKILVTGGAGFIGSHIINHLLNETDYEVICVDNFDDYYDVNIKEGNIAPFLENPRFKLYRLDICDSDGMNKIFIQEKPDKIIHLAGLAGVRESLKKPDLYEKVNVDATKNLLELSKKHDIKNFVFASTSSVYGNQKKVPFSEDDSVEPISPYGQTKLDVEKIARSYNMPITCLRFFTVYGPSGRPDMAPYKFTDLIYRGQPIPKFGDGTSERDYTYIDDIVQGVISALEKDLPFEIINIGNNQTISLNDFIQLIEKLLGKKALIDQLPMQPGDVDITYADITKAEKFLDYKPTTSVEEGMKKFIDWYIANL